MSYRAIFLASVWLASCGTHVDAGDNLEAQTPAADDNGGDGESDGGSPGSGDARKRGGGGTTPSETDGDVPGEGDGDSGAGEGDGDEKGTGDDSGGDGGGSTGAKLTCYGPAPELKGGVQAFCDGLGEDLKATFAKSYDWICNQRRLVNLFLRPCSWTGENGSEKYRRVLEKTDLQDMNSQDFHFLGAYGMTSQSTPEDHLSLIYREMTDPSYDDRFVSIRNSRLYDIVPRADGGFEYSVEFASSAATVGFRAALHAQTFGNLVAVFDYAIGGQVLVKEHRFLRLMLPGADAGTTRVVAVDEKLISDGGQHQVAYQNLTEVLKQRMERDYENSRRD